MPLSKLAAAAVFAAAAALAAAEQLPLKTYTTVDGLPSDRIHCILPDSHGYLWFGTSDGLARFDGYGFANFGMAEGLPGPEAQALIEASDGTYWVATNHGLAHWDPAREPKSRRTPATLHFADGKAADDVQALIEGRPGELWAGTRAGLFRVTRTGTRWSAERMALPAPEKAVVNALASDGDGAVLVGTDVGLFRLAADRPPTRIGDASSGPRVVHCVRRIRDGSLWVGTENEGLMEIHGSRVVRSFSADGGLAGNDVTALLETADGTLWAACYGGVSEISPDRARVRRYTTAEGLSGFGMWSLAEDRSGNLWIGSDDSGLMRLPRSGFRRYDARDGLRSERVAALFAGPGGEPCAFTRARRLADVADDAAFFECFDGSAFQSLRLRLPPRTPFGWGWRQLTFVDENGEWWVPTFTGLFRFPAVPLDRLAATPFRRRYTTADGLPSDQLYRLFRDGHGDVWMGLAGDGPHLALWRRASDAIRVFSPAADGVPDALPMAFAEDRSGTVWIGFFGGGLARWRGGRMEALGAAQGLPPGSVRALHVDRSGRLWIATGSGGVARLDRPDSDAPRIASVEAGRASASRNAYSIAEDRLGRIYVGTERGLDRYDPHGDTLRHFTSDDGLSRGVVESSLLDREGRLWFGSSEGLSSLSPAPEAPAAAPAVRIRRVLLDGAEQPVPELGASRVRVPEAGRESAPLEIEFAGADFASGGRLRYQHRLEGIERGWSEPSEQRSVVYARLPAGTYRFRARGAGPDGARDADEATVDFVIAPVFWKRPWVLAAAAALLAAGAYGLHRTRLASAVAVARVRARVATDLHDDIGAGLSEIAILSDLARRPAEKEGPPPGSLLEEIGESARGLVDSMSDIVWSTDPRRDDGASLLQRIRRFAANTLESRGIAWTLEAPPRFELRRIDPEPRRQIYLIVKEALANVARHSRCTRAAVRFTPAAADVGIEIEDDGAGFSAPGAGEDAGHGLANMRSRALALGGDFSVESGPSAGTRLRIRVPLSRWTRSA